MSVRLDDEMDLGEIFFLLATVHPINGMDEMSVRLDDGTDLGEVFFLLVTVCPN
jgi:hypothetical protein